MLAETLHTSEIAKIFRKEITSFGGKVFDCFDDGRRLFLRALLPREDTVRPEDRVQGGVALKAVDNQIQIYPYIFRIVCSNGAVMAHVLETRSIHLPKPKDDTIEEIRAAARACTTPEAFSIGVAQMRSALHAPGRESEKEVARLLELRDYTAPHGPDTWVKFVEAVLENSKEIGPSRFAVINAITSTARDTDDPELRWWLEELGGAVAADQLSLNSTRSAAATSVA